MEVDDARLQLLEGKWVVHGRTHQSLGSMFGPNGIDGALTTCPLDRFKISKGLYFLEVTVEMTSSNTSQNLKG